MFKSNLASLLSPRNRIAAPALVSLAVALAGCSGGGSAASTNPALSLAPSSLSFGAVVTATSSPAQTVTLTNSGNAALSISNVSASGDFSVTPVDCGASLAAGNTTCRVAVVFMPTALGARTGTLTVSSNNPGGAQTVALTGTGTAPGITLAPASLTFSPTTKGSTSAAQTITVTSSGTAPLTIQTVSSTTDFTATASGCTAALAPASTCQISVVFAPSIVGARTGTVTVTSNAPGGPQTVAVSGTGTAPIVYTGASFPIVVQAGNQTVAGASVQLYAAGTTGNGSAPTALLAAPVLTGVGGAITIPAAYNCPSATAMVYLVSRGGTVSGTSGANANIALMTAIGACGSLSSSSKFIVNEATTVAAAYGLAQFYAAGGAIGATSTNLTGLTNAFATASTLTNPVAGTSPGSALPASAVSPAPRVNSVANLVNACVASSSACAALYTATTVGTSVPTNTLDAISNLALHPGANIATLYTQSLASTAFAPVLGKIPSDWTMFINYGGGGLNNPSGIGVDSTGSVWVANYFFVASKFTPTGTPVFPTGITNSGLNNSYGLAIDLGDNVWIPNEQPFTAQGIGSVTELSSSGTSLSGGNGFTAGGLNYPLSVAIDPNGTTWVVDYGNSHLTLLNSQGVPLSGTDGYTTPLFAFPVAVAIDSNHFGWIVNQSSNNVTKVSPDGKTFTNYNCCNLASGIAIDQGNNVWVANYFGDSISLLKNDGTVISSNYNGLGSVYHPQGIAIDGAGNVWIANYRAPYLSALTGSTSPAPGTAISPATGFGADAALLEAYAIALDASGNIWISNQGNNTITKFIGMAVPVKTPLSALPKTP